MTWGTNGVRSAGITCTSSLCDLRSLTEIGAMTREGLVTLVFPGYREKIPFQRSSTPRFVPQMGVSRAKGAFLASQANHGPWKGIVNYGGWCCPSSHGQFWRNDASGATSFPPASAFPPTRFAEPKEANVERGTWQPSHRLMADNGACDPRNSSHY
jgi:hypothetical protein